MATRRASDERRREGAEGAVVSLRPYSIGTAARLAGLSPSVVRMWEVRYRFLDPDRTGGGHRLYSDDDVRVLRAVKSLLDGGLRIGAVARMPRDAILAAAAQRAPAGPPPGVGESALLQDRDRLVEEILAAAAELDADRVASLLDRPRLLIDGADVVLELYLPLLVRAGDLWHAGRLPIAVEHFVEKLVTARLHAVLSSTPASGTGRLALLACAPKERHEGGLLAAATLLKRAGFAVANLGADLPVDELVGAATRSAPSVIVLASTIAPPAPIAESLVDALRRAPLVDVPLVLGGAGATKLGERLQRRPRVVVSHDVRAVVADVHRALRA